MSKDQRFAICHPTHGINAASCEDSEYYAWLRFWAYSQPGQETFTNLDTFKAAKVKEGWKARPVKLTVIEDAPQSDPVDRLDYFLAKMETE